MMVIEISTFEDKYGPAETSPRSYVSVYVDCLRASHGFHFIGSRVVPCVAGGNLRHAKFDGLEPTRHLL
jgi:hypothetical protein